MGHCVSMVLAFLAAASSPPRPDARRLIEKVIEMQELHQEQQRQYSYLETIATEHFHKDGTLDKVESETFQVTPSPDGEYRRLVAENGRPLPPKKEKEEEEKFREYIEKQLERSEAERQRETKEKLASRVSRFQTRLGEALDVYEFTELPDDTSDGKRLRCFRFSPREGYQPRSRDAKILNRLEGTIWIDPKESQIAKLHIIFREDMKFFFGLFGRVSKGSQAVAEQWQTEDGLWLLHHVTASLDARLYFFKNYRRRIIYSYSDYEKYDVETEESDFRPATTSDGSP